MTDEEAIKQLEEDFERQLRTDKSPASVLAKYAYELGARPKEREFPQREDEYYYVEDEGRIISDTWCDYHLDNNRLRQGNVFRTKEAAEREARRRKVRAKIAAIDAMYEPTDPKYIYKHSDGKFYFSSAPEFIGAIRVKSLLAAERVLAEIPAEDLHLLIMQPEFVVPR